MKAPIVLSVLFEGGEIQASSGIEGLREKMASRLRPSVDQWGAGRWRDQETVVKAGQKYESTDHIISSIRGRRDSSQFRGTPAFDAKHWVRPPVKGVGTIVTGVFADRRVEGKDGVEAPTISGPVSATRGGMVAERGASYRDWFGKPSPAVMRVSKRSRLLVGLGKVLWAYFFFFSLGPFISRMVLDYFGVRSGSLHGSWTRRI
ncbi:hypothetical protein L2E82_20385 [Cichorium intybus]|uniref:Uncharacterized protein n=1 Tax=Cichorium intybus TaxID=13427 RepID=A0ACB9DST0_CICIN|nr:hypothetical protein L2E82_20385 [Cichorium intybus]